MRQLRSTILALTVAAGIGLTPDATVAQATGTITGTVVDATSARPLESAQVFLPALNQGGLTNQQGRFLLLNVPTGTHEISVELIGYSSSTQQVTVQAGETATVEFQLNSTALRLQELVVTGVAGETPRVKLPFSVERVDFTDMPVPAPSAEGLLQGKVAGAKVVRGSGQPGSESSIMLRGPTSITGSQQPLIIVDGVITDNTMADIDALDVESIEVVKGPAAASLYGSRAQNGVIQIQTKRGSGLAVDDARMIVRNEAGTQALEGEVALTANHIYLMDAAQTGFIPPDDSECAGRVISYTEIAECGVPVIDNTAIGGLTQGSPETTFQDNLFPGRLYDQIGTFFDPGEQYSNYVAVEGRTGTTNYRASFTNFREQGVLDFNDGFKRKNFRLNLDHQVFDDLDISLNTYYAQSETDDVDNDAFFSLTLMHRGADLTAIDPETGRFVVSPDPLSLEVNPLYEIRYEDRFDDRQRFMGSLFARYTPTDWFGLEANYSLDRSDFNRQRMQPLGFVSDVDAGPTSGDLFRENRISNDVNASLTASFNHAFGDLTTRTKLRYLVEDQHEEGFTAFGDDFSVADVPVLQSTVGSRNITSFVQDIISEGYFFISALDYQGKYIGDFLVRRDGSSLFGEDERWQTYYRGSAAWRLAQEGWWPFDAVGEFKLRYSLGTAGGRPGFSAQYETYSVNQGIITPISLGNDQLKPEFATEQEFGVEMVLWDKVSMGATYAHSIIEDQLLEVPLPSFAGFQEQWQNAGEIESNTFEAFLESSVLASADRSLSFRLNFDRTRQEITRLDVPPYRVGPGDEFYVREGEALGTFYGIGFAKSCADLPEGSAACSEFQVNDDGYLVWVGQGNSWRDGISGALWGTESAEGHAWGMPIQTENEEGLNFVRLGNTTPDYNLSLSTNFRWKGFGLSMLLDSEQGADIYNQTAQWAYRELRHGNTDQAGKSDETKKPFAYYQNLYATNARSGAFVEEASYVKLREMSLRYTIDQGMLDNLFGGFGMDQATVSLIGRNLMTWTDYTGYDPEVGVAGGNGFGSAAVGRVDTFQYPNFRSMTAALELIF